MGMALLPCNDSPPTIDSWIFLFMMPVKHKQEDILMLSAKKLTLAATALFAGISMAEAQDALKPSVTVDEAMGTKIVRIDDKQVGNHLTVHRAMLDSAAGLVCEWTAEGQIDPDTNKIQGQYTSHTCAQTTDVPDAWKGGIEKPLSATRKVSANGDVITETSTSSFTSVGVQSHYTREWNLATNSVSISAGECQLEGGICIPYLAERQSGAFLIPDNGYVAKLRAELGQP